MNMKRRAISALVATTAAVGLMAGPAGAVDITQPHPHSLLIGFNVELQESGPPLITYRKCVDLAGGNRLPLNAHHSNLHAAGGTDELGRGINNKGIRTAGHAVIPYSCDSLPF